MRKHRSGYNTFHNGTVGLSVERIRKEAELRDEIEDFIDQKEIDRDWSSQDPQKIREEIRKNLQKPDFSWALKPANGPPLSYYLFRGTGWRSILALLIALPFILILSPIWLIILSNKEKADKEAAAKN